MRLQSARLSGNDLAATNTIFGQSIFFEGGFAESGRDYNTVDVSELQNTIFPPFKAAVDAGVELFMNSFNNEWNSLQQKSIPTKRNIKRIGILMVLWCQTGGSINER
jgi:beta-glucosidase